MSQKLPLNVKKYPHQSWAEKFPNAKSKLTLSTNESWKDVMTEFDKDERSKDIVLLMNKCIEKKKDVFPYPDLVFSAFNFTNYNDVKVVFIGMDPYFNKKEVDEKFYPEAMGLSFSVPVGVPIPSSLKNIYKNMVKYNHVKKSPDHGNLEAWAKQGCLMLNASLTVQEFEVGSQMKFWEWFTDDVVKKISREKDHVVFVIWGAFAYKKLAYIDTDKHSIIISSHPSGLSCSKGFKSYPAFNDFDHFGEINKKLVEHKQKQVDWQIA